MSNTVTPCINQLCNDVPPERLQFVAGPFPSAPYYKGHFSNGRVWIEIVAATFGAELENFATGNAISGAAGEALGNFTVQPPYAYLSNATQVLVPSTLDQVGTSAMVVPAQVMTLEELIVAHHLYLQHLLPAA